MSKVLVISYFLTLRTRKFLEFLPQHGVEPIFLTSINPVMEILNKTKKSTLNHNVNVYYSWNLFPLEYLSSLLLRMKTNFRLFFLPDIYITWIPQTLIKSLRLIKKNNIKMIYVSGGPFSAAIIGALIRKITGIPLIVDFRDPWTLDPDPSLAYPTRFHMAFDKFLEEFVVTTADYIVTATQSISSEYTNCYPFLKNKIKSIPNGFDLNDFYKDLDLFSKFTITYTGAIYGSGSRPYRSFFQALHGAISSNSIDPKSIQVFFVGENSRRFIDDINVYHLQNIVIPMNRISQKEALKYTQASHVLLVIELTNAVTTKVYEYLATGHTILAIVSNGELLELIKSYSSNSYVVVSEDDEYIKKIIIKLYQMWKQDKLISNNPAILGKFRDLYNREKLTNDLADIFNSLLNKSN